MNTLNLSKFDPFFVGFDQLFDRMNTLPSQTGGYPPYNIVKVDETNYTIEMAVAGFTKKDIEIEIKDGYLTVSGDIEDDGREYVYRGISSRAFARRFSLADDVVVKDASLENGMLIIEMEKIIPEEKKPRLISIK